MANGLLLSYESGNDWESIGGGNTTAMQLATRVTFPSTGGLITSLQFQVAAASELGTNDTAPVAGCVWDGSSEDLLTASAIRTLGDVSGFPNTWQSFDVPNLEVAGSKSIYVGFWRRCDTVSYSTKWQYDNSRTGYNMYEVSGGTRLTSPGAFRNSSGVTSLRRSNASLTYRIVYTYGGRVRVWNGSSFVVGTPKVWNGTTWVGGVAKVWNGTTWVETKV